MANEEADVRISATARPSWNHQRQLLTIAHDGAPGWPTLLQDSHRAHDLANILYRLPETASCRLTAWQGSRLVGLLLAETNRTRGPGFAQLLRHIWRRPSRLPEPLQRLLASSAYHMPPGHDGYVIALVVHPDWRRQAIGLRLVQALYQKHRALLWTAHTDHPGSQALFVRAGFEEITRTEAEGLTIRTLRGPARDMTQDPEGSGTDEKPTAPAGCRSLGAGTRYAGPGGITDR